MLETFRDLNEIGAAIAAVRGVCDLPIVAQMTTEEDGNSLDGTPPEQFAPMLVGARRQRRRRQLQRRTGADARIDRAARRRDATARLSAQPNAGKPRDIEGRNIYLCSPEYMASYARRFIAQRRAPGRRLLRHDARAHPADQRGREANGAPRGSRPPGKSDTRAATVAERPARAVAGVARGEVAARRGHRARASSSSASSSSRRAAWPARR